MTNLSQLHPNILNVIGKAPDGKFRGVPADDFLITGGQSFIVLARADATLSLNGEGWENSASAGSSVASAPQSLRELKPGKVREPLTSILPSPPSALLSNYPNPFNPETWLPFRLRANAQVIMRIYSIEGNIVRSLDLGWQSTGEHLERSEAAYWDGRNNYGEQATSGIYFYTMSTRNRAGKSEVIRAPHKLLLLK
jgi:hypothetical protein